MITHKVGDIVKINLPAGLQEGIIVAGPSVKWSFDGEVKYEVHGTNKKNPFVTIISERGLIT